MNSPLKSVLLVIAIGVGMATGLNAQGRTYAGAIAGVSTLSADGRSVIGANTSAVSQYKPENGAAVNVFGGVAVSDFVTLQGNYMWNRNGLTLNSTLSGDTPTFYEQTRHSAQHAVIGDVLLYFRDRADSVRPYLSGGLGAVHFTSSPLNIVAERGMPSPPAAFSDTTIGLRVAVGIDIKVAPGWAVRYSFSETIGKNPISRTLSPPGERRLANFQNLVGFMRYF